MYGQDYLSCIKVPASKQSTTKGAQKFEQIKPMDFAASHRDLISTANKVFGEGKWNHTVVNQTLDYVDTIGAKCCVGCVSSVKVELDNGNFHEDIGYYVAEESTKGLSMYNARIGSATSALKRVLLSFGGKFNEELKRLQKQTSHKQNGTKQKDMAQLSDDEQIQEKSNIPVQIHVSHVPQIEHKEINKNIVPNIINNIVAKINSPAKNEDLKEIVQSTSDVDQIKKVQSNDTVTKNKEKLHEEARRLERKRKQLEKQMEFKRRMIEKEELISSNNNKPNPKY